ncbi:hypothetical protein BD626DRAFT_122854 [Schizophyllum amplum]|uniref:Uncharacterized protein n=1 Tax=Schizophyllum amplum TaxID=97359 RepID=A0A550C7R1_9AGAR|nr:hypothetical protein BD626DRAFT_122854 [Auriculariopsis ampla]
MRKRAHICTPERVWTMRQPSMKRESRNGGIVSMEASSMMVMVLPKDNGSSEPPRRDKPASRPDLITWTRHVGIRIRCSARWLRPSRRVPLDDTICNSRACVHNPPPGGLLCRCTQTWSSPLRRTRTHPSQRAGPFSASPYMRARRPHAQRPSSQDARRPPQASSSSVARGSRIYKLCVCGRIPPGSERGEGTASSMDITLSSYRPVCFPASPRGRQVSILTHGSRWCSGWPTSVLLGSRGPRPCVAGGGLLAWWPRVLVDIRPQTTCTVDMYVDLATSTLIVPQCQRPLSREVDNPSSRNVDICHLADWPLVVVLAQPAPFTQRIARRLPLRRAEVGLIAHPTLLDSPVGDFLVSSPVGVFVRTQDELDVLTWAMSVSSSRQCRVPQKAISASSHSRRQTPHSRHCASHTSDPQLLVRTPIRRGIEHLTLSTLGSSYDRPYARLMAHVDRLPWSTSVSVEAACVASCRVDVACVVQSCRGLSLGVDVRLLRQAVVSYSLRFGILFASAHVSPHGRRPLSLHVSVIIARTPIVGSRCLPARDRRLFSACLRCPDIVVDLFAQSTAPRLHGRHLLACVLDIRYWNDRHLSVLSGDRRRTMKVANQRLMHSTSISYCGQSKSRLAPSYFKDSAWQLVDTRSILWTPTRQAL